MKEPSLSLDGFRVVHAQDDFVVLEKASGLLSVPGIGAHNADCLATRVALVFPGARNVHRLDQHTSGLIVMALMEAPDMNDEELGVKVGLSQSQVKKIFSEVEFGSGGG